MPDIFDLDNRSEDIIRLSETEQGNPAAVFRSFFADNSMGEVRGLFGDILETCITTDNIPFRNAESRSKLLSIGRGVERCLEAGLVYARSGEAASNEVERLE